VLKMCCLGVCLDGEIQSGLGFNGGFMNYLARRDTMPFYRHKSTINNTWPMGISNPYLRTKLLLEGSQIACIGRFICP
jgi:hypothetical protein